MAVQQTVVQGTCYDVLGNLANTRLVRVMEARRSGELIEIENQHGVVNESGLLKAADGVSDFKLPRNSQVKLTARIVGLDTTGGVWVTVPDSAGPVDLATLIAVASIPSTGLTVKSNGVALASLIGTLNITGDGAVVTQTSAGVAELAFAAGVGGGNHNLLSATHPDSTAASPSRGDVIIGQGASAKWARKALGAAGSYLRSDGTDLLYSALLAADIPSLDAAKITSGQFADARIASAAVWNAKQDALGFTPENSANKNQANGYAGLDSSSKLNPSHLPAIAISNYLGSVASQVAMLALTGERGDWAIRSDENKTYILIGDDASQIGNWQAIATPTDLVSSVFGRTGAVTAQANDYNFNQIAGSVALNQLHTDVLIASDIGVSVQAQSDILTDLAGLTQAADKLPYFSSGSAMALADFSAFGRSLIDDADASAGRSTLGVVIGTNVQAFSARLSEVASIGSALQQIRVNAGGTALEYFTPSAGGGTPGGSDTQVQFNDGGAFGGDAGFTYNKTTDSITLAGVITADKFKTSGPYLQASNINGNSVAILAGDFNTYRRVVAAGFIIGPDDSSSADIQFNRIDTSVAIISNPAGGGGVLEMSQVASLGTVSANSGRIGVKDEAGTAEWYVKDEAGNETKISPHDSKTGEWIFYSVNEQTGKGYRVDMEKLVEEVERLSGKQLSKRWLIPTSERAPISQ